MPKPTISISRAKAHLRIQHDLDDDLIEAYAEAAVDRALAEIGLAGELEGVKSASVLAPLSRFRLPVYSIDSLKVDGVDILPADYVLSGNWDTGQTLVIADSAWLVNGKRQLIYTPGWEITPSWFEVACLFLIAHYYENRSSVGIAPGLAAVEVPMGFEHLLKPHKSIFFA